MQIDDHGGRRFVTDRRQILSPINFSDRRSDRDRRSEDDRRSGSDRRSEKGFRSIIGMDRRIFFKNLFSDLIRPQRS